MCWKQTTVSNPLTFKIFTDRKESAENCSVWQTCIANRIMGLWKLASILCMLLIVGPVMGAPRGNGKHIFILAGQSNMAGRGGVSGGKWSGYVPPESKPDSSILRLNAELKWVEAKEPLHADIDVGKTCGVGPGMAFANQVLRAQGTRIGVLGLVPCGVGGTRISEWARGTQLYNKLLRRAGESVKEGGSIRAILWYQGESDTVRKEDVEAYKANMERLILDLRSDLNISNLLFIQVWSSMHPFISFQFISFQIPFLSV